MPELTKEQLSEKINNALGLDMDFSKMSKKDLFALSNSFAEKQENSTMHSAEFFRRPLKEILNLKVLGKEVGDLSLIELFQQMFFPFKREGGGLLGFGILPFRLEPLRKRRQ